MKTSLSLLAGLLMTAGSLAQNVPDTLTTRPGTLAKSGRRAVIKFAPLALFEVQNTFELGLEVPVGKQLYVQGQLGYAPSWLMWAYSRANSARYTDRENWRGRLELRWYGRTFRSSSGNASRSGAPLGTYYAVETHFRQLNAREAITIGRLCQDGCDYFEKAVQPISRYSAGLGIKVGTQRTLLYMGPNKNRRLVLDSYVGMGIRYAWTVSGRTLLPSDRLYERLHDFVLFNPFNAPTGLLPNPLIGAKLGYVL